MNIDADVAKRREIFPRIALIIQKLLIDSRYVACKLGIGENALGLVHHHDIRLAHQTRNELRAHTRERITGSKAGSMAMLIVLFKSLSINLTIDRCGGMLGATYNIEPTGLCALPHHLCKLPLSRSRRRQHKEMQSKS